MLIQIGLMSCSDLGYLLGIQTCSLKDKSRVVQFMAYLHDLSRFSGNCNNDN